VLIERIRVGGDLYPLAAASNDRQHRGPRRHDPHVVLQLRHMLFRRRLSENDQGSINLAEDLSQQSCVSLRTIRRAEIAERQTAMTAANDLAVRRALESAGVEFTNGERPGVRLTKAAAAHSVQPASAPKPTAAAKPVRGKTAKATKKKR
jgi:hypothetical protein